MELHILHIILDPFQAKICYGEGYDFQFMDLIMDSHDIDNIIDKIKQLYPNIDIAELIFQVSDISNLCEERIAIKLSDESVIFINLADMGEVGGHGQATMGDHYTTLKTVANSNIPT